MPNKDPHTEPENSTVDNWMGQEVNKDMDKADRLMKETGGDAEAAERRFEQESEGAEPNAGEVKRAGGKGFA
jgi:hypothetical protein